MLNNISNFFSLLRGKRVKKTLAPNDMIAIGVRNPVTQSDYQPSAIFYKDLEAQIAAGVTPVAPNLQAVVNTGNSITNFGGIGTASMSSINFTNNRALYLNNNANPTIRIVDNLNAANTLQIDIDTLTLDGVSYNWSSIVNQGLPAWVETNATDKTVWCRGVGTSITNTGFGDKTLTSITSATASTAFGTNVLKNNSSGQNNIGVGFNALSGNTFGSNNTAIGTISLEQNQLGNNNTALGFRTLSLNIASLNTALGTDALKLNTTGNNNTAVGLSALANNTTAGNNTAVGVNALTNNLTGARNTAVGQAALVANQSGTDNTAIGRTALYNSTGSLNVALGTNSLDNLVSGSRNTAIGTDANVANTTTNGSTMIGYGARATGNNQFVVGSLGTNAGAVVTGVNTSSKYWDVIINGVAEKILLA